MLPDSKAETFFKPFTPNCHCLYFLLSVLFFSVRRLRVTDSIVDGQTPSKFRYTLINNF